MGYVSRLRSTLGASGIEGKPEGYRLCADIVDAYQFESLIHGTSACDDSATLERALGLWRGDAFGEFSTHLYLVGEVRRLEGIRTHTRIRLASLYLDARYVARPTSMLEAIVADDLCGRMLGCSWFRRCSRWSARPRPCVRRTVPADPGRDRARAGHRRSSRPRRCPLDRTPPRPVGRLPAPIAWSTVGPVRYARSRPDHLAYQVVGGGPVDLVLSSYGSVSIDSIWDSEPFTSSSAPRRVVSRGPLRHQGHWSLRPDRRRRPAIARQQSEDLLAVLADARRLGGW